MTEPKTATGLDEITLTRDRLVGEEDYRGFPYNDKTGKPVSLASGSITIGYGCNISAGWTRAFSMRVLQIQLADVQAHLVGFEWYQQLNAPRRSVFLDCGFNIGVAGLLHFTDTITFARQSQWQKCHDAFLDSKAARQLPTRYDPLALILLTGDIA